jgi:uncharacterized protein YecE (DUF72 family)
LARSFAKWSLPIFGKLTSRFQMLEQRLDIDKLPLPLIGCAGWSIASVQQAHFPPNGTHLERYAAVFPAVEINSSFYRPHRPETYRRWGESVPDNFRFSVKVPRAITHERRLQNADELVFRFSQEVGELKARLGCLLVQLPPSLGFNRHTVTAFFRSLTERVGVPVVCEARHLSWFTPEVTEVLAMLGIAQVIADPPVASVAAVASVVYVRLHGSPEMYHSAYSDTFLTKLSHEIRLYQAEGKTVWCIFDNTASGAAMPNALTLLARFNEKLVPGFGKEA